MELVFVSLDGIWKEVSVMIVLSNWGVKSVNQELSVLSAILQKTGSTFKESVSVDQATSCKMVPSAHHVKTKPSIATNANKMEHALNALTKE